MKNILQKLFVLFVLLIFIFALSACGKSSMPKPPKSNQELSFEAVGGKLVNNNCIAIQGTLSGAVDNLNDIVFEFEPIDDNSCTTCPFTSRERQVFSAWNLGIKAENPNFSKLYCPQLKGKGVLKGFRWRLVATNVYLNLPNVISTEVLTYLK
ncbi:hypothetical protein [Desulfovibrio litoralis]|uniref:Lipoprotein n=1 Tax=Desulfovibrio litoralis DSM 11393 TaxID=1121455 RepID=A0A1M7TAL2_9BACT|nr:hypothetical protein [Desulfovibrio litoralis]SHN67769.1 hypothetical protein SAMN02745728_01783 [Desulfovibrio litoralis DSM 11393]